MQIKLLKDLVGELAGEESGIIVEILFNKKDVNEFLIAKKMSLTINQVRNILYKLSAEGLVSFIRKKDKRKGWYIYYWTLNTEKCLIRLELAIKQKIKELKAELEKRQHNRFYQCKQCNIEVNEETALEHGFSCEECFDVYELADNEGPIRAMKGKISRKETELKVIEKELEDLRGKAGKKKARREERESKKKIKKKEKVVKKKKSQIKKMRKLLKRIKKKVIRKKLGKRKKKAKGVRKKRIKKKKK